jgi:succinate dehydrogenase / fumarate reductase cytochrome b subunit
MNRLTTFYGTSIGKKLVVAITGLMMYGFIIGHMLGNLKAFGGATALDQYAEMLREIGAQFLGNTTFLWIARVTLIVAVVLHVATIIQLVKRNRSGQPTRKIRRRNASTLAAKWMAVSGTLILVFIVIHLAQFTFGWINIHEPGTEGFETGAVYSNIWGAFNVWWVALFYVAMMAMVCMHVYHGAWSMFQTLGLDAPDRNKLIRTGVSVLAIILFVGFSAVPIAMLTNSIPSPEESTETDSAMTDESENQDLKLSGDLG